MILNHAAFYLIPSTVINNFIQKFSLKYYAFKLTLGAENLTKFQANTPKYVNLHKTGQIL